MKKLTHSAAARAAAFILCLLCGLTALLCAAGYFMTRIDRDRTLPEPDSVSVYKNGIRVLLNNALQEERYTGEYPELPSGYSYVATDTSTGKVLYDGRTKNAVPLGISGGCSIGVSWIDAQAYLEPKQTPGEELTLLRTSVGTLLRYQNAYLPVGIITAVLCIALLVFLMASMGKKPDGVKLRGIHRVPLDLFLAAALAAVAVGVEGARIAKSLSFKVEDQPIIIVVAGDAKVDNSRYKAQFHTKAKMLTHEEAHELIGHDVGGVCPFALPEDVKVYLDVSMKRFETVFPAAGSSNSAVEMTCDELERYASNFAAWVDVCKGWRPEEQG